MKQPLMSVEKSMGVSGFLQPTLSDSYISVSIDLVEVANNLNAPEGFLVQARDGTEDSSEIMGRFLTETQWKKEIPLFH